MRCVPAVESSRFLKGYVACYATNSRVFKYSTHSEQIGCWRVLKCAGSTSTSAFFHCEISSASSFTAKFVNRINSPLPVAGFYKFTSRCSSHHSLANRFIFIFRDVHSLDEMRVESAEVLQDFSFDDLHEHKQVVCLVD